MFIKDFIKKKLKDTTFYWLIWNWRLKKRQSREIKKWRILGFPNPPPHYYKQQVLKHYAEKYNIRIFVETGTYLGDMVEAMKASFDKIYSIEISQDFFNRTKKRFKSEEKLKLIWGDSGKKLKNVCDEINQPALFWLDGHYSGGKTEKGEKETPIFEELSHIIKKDIRNVIIIDDARCFGRIPDYPSIPQLKKFIISKRNDVNIIVLKDMIRITPK